MKLDRFLLSRRAGRLTVALVAFVIACLYTAQATTMSRGSVDRPGAGLYPLVIGVFFIGTTVITAVEAFFKRGDQVEGPMRLEHGTNFVLFIVAMLAYVVAFQPLGFIVSTFLAVAAVSMIVPPMGGIRRVLYSLVFAAGFTALLYWFFAMLMQIRLPEGIYAPAL